MIKDSKFVSSLLIDRVIGEADSEQVKNQIEADEKNTQTLQNTLTNLVKGVLCERTPVISSQPEQQKPTPPPAAARHFTVEMLELLGSYLISNDWTIKPGSVFAALFETAITETVVCVQGVPIKETPQYDASDLRDSELMHYSTHQKCGIAFLSTVCDKLTIV